MTFHKTGYYFSVLENSLKMKQTKQKLWQIIIQLLNIIFITITIGLLVIAIFKPSLIKAFLAWIEITIKWLGNWNYIIAFVSATIESFPVIGVLVPGMQVMLLVWGFFWRHAIAEVIILAILWAMLGNYIWYILGIKYWDSFFKKYWDWFWLWKTELKFIKKQIEKNGFWFIVLGKFHNLTRAFIPFIAGSMWMKQKNFWLYNVLGSIIWATTIITLGVIFSQYYEKIVDFFPYILLWILIIVWIYIAIFKRKEFGQYITDKNAEIDEKINQKS